MKTTTIELTQRELTLIRVACIRRLNFLQREGLADSQADMAQSYDETMALLNGKLWAAVRAFPGVKEVI